MVFISIGLCIVVAIVAFVAVVDFCLVIHAYSKYKERTLNHTYQRLNAKVIISTNRLFSDRYIYERPNYDWLRSLTYMVIEPSGNAFYPNKTEYYILLNFIDYCRINRFITREQSEEERKRVSERETNAVLADLHKLTTEEIKKANREVDNAIADMRKEIKKANREVDNAIADMRKHMKK